MLLNEGVVSQIGSVKGRQYDLKIQNITVVIFMMTLG